MAIDLRDITSGDGSQGFVLHGERQELAGFSVASAGDFNGDGFDDMIIGAPGADGSTGTGTDVGNSYLVFGKSGGFDAAIDLASIMAGDGSKGFVLQGGLADDKSGTSVASAGDVNGDGFDDLIVGAPHADGPADGRSGAGDSYVVFGKPSVSNAIFDLASIASGDGSQGFVLQGVGVGDYSGRSVSSAGDVNGDGLADLIIGAPRASGPADGRPTAGDSYVVFGKAGGFGGAIDLATIAAGDGSRGFVLYGELAGDQSGGSVSSAGDVNGDGFDDLIIGAQYGDGPADGRSYAGDSYVVFGKASGFAATIDLAGITAGDGSLGFVLQGGGARDYAGIVASAGDVNGDGFGDLIVGASGGDGPANGRTDAGESYVVFGKGSGFGAAIDLAAIASGDGSLGFVLQGVSAGDYSGRSVSSAGDVNGDGFDDLIIGATRADGPADGRSSAGDSYVVFGKSGGFGGAIDLVTIAAGTGGFVIHGERAEDRSGWAVASAGDVNGDGFDDLMIGAPVAKNITRYDGNSYVIFGSATVGGSASHLTQPAGGNAADTLTGGASTADVLVGGRGNDTMLGRGGADSLRGGEGDDILGIGGSGFARIDGGNGTDSLLLTGAMTLSDDDFRRMSSMDGITLGNQAVHLTLGRNAAHAFGGLAASNFQIKINGIDNMTAALTIDAASFNQGLVADLSNNSIGVTIVGGMRASQVTGGSGADDLRGGAEGDTLNGNAGDDRLNGGAGVDTLDGGFGNDTYFVDNAGDKIVEGAGGGTLDYVATSVSYVLGAAVQVEKFAAASSGGTAAINLTGNEFVQAITGNAGANVIDGKAGADTMTGLGGDDFYFVDVSGASGDQVVEAAGGGNDTIAAKFSYTIATGVEVETLRTTSTANTTAIALAGNEFSQLILGNAGVNTLNGRGGHDTLTGLGGADAFVFDRAPSSANYDHIVDFAHGVDKIRLDDDIFTALAPGNLTPTAFKDISVGTKDADDRVIYNHNNGGLYYDSDGSGAAAQVLIAILDNHATMTASDFLVIA